MADAQIGNVHGVAAAGNTTGKIGNVTADGANTVTLDTVAGLSAGDQIDIINPDTGAVLASDRNVSNITDAGVVTYSGADVAGTVNHDVYRAGTFTDSSLPNLNGGNAIDSGYNDSDLLTIAAMKTRLQAIDAGLYTDAYLNTMTVNDMKYAIRLNDAVGTI